MKKLIIFSYFLAMLSIPCVAEELWQGDKLVKNLELEFDDRAKVNNGFITWELSGDWDKFDYDFSQGKLHKNVFTIHANEYKDFANGEAGIALTIVGKSKTPQGDYTLSMHVTEVSDDLEFPKEELDADFHINYLLPPPPPLWKRLLVPGIVLLALIIIFLIVLDRTARFPKGLLQIGHYEVKLKGKKMVSVREEMDKNSISLPSDTDVVFVKKRFASFQGPCVKEMKNCILELNGLLLTKGMVVHLDDEVKGLTDTNRNELVIRYC